MLGFGMGFGMILFWIAIAAVVVLIIKGLSNNSTREDERSRQETPLDILKRRYAAGEIPRDEFESKKHDLISG